MDDLPVYRIERDFDAPLELVWRAWTDPELLNQWYGPGVETIVHEFELRPGGVWRNEMRWGGNSDFQKMVFREIVPLERMVWHHSPADADWNVTANPRMPDWPKTLLTTVTFELVEGTASVRLTQVPHQASETELACFAETMGGMDQGWSRGYAILDEMLRELQAR